MSNLFTKYIKEMVENDIKLGRKRVKKQAFSLFLLVPQSQLTEIKSNRRRAIVVASSHIGLSHTKYRDCL